MNRSMNIIVESFPEHTSAKIITVTGELDDTNLSQLQEMIEPVLNDVHNTVIIFNFDGLEFMGSSVVGYFAELYNKMSDDNRKVIFTECNPTINDIITFVGLDRVIACHPHLKDAIKVTKMHLSNDK